MELQAFVTEALTQIIDAVAEASKHAASKGAFVNPRMAEQPMNRPLGRTTETVHTPDPEIVKNLGVFLARDNRLVDMIEFDVAVTASSTAEEKTDIEGRTKGVIGLKVVSMEVGGGGASSSGLSSSDTRVSHVKFRIPVALPIQAGSE